MAERWQLEYDQRRYADMEDQLRLYEEGRISLGSLISNLWALLSYLEAPDEGWQDEFASAWWILEEVYAEACIQVEKGVSPNIDTVISEPDNQRLIREGITRIKRLVADRTRERNMADDA